jgi:hypothetical protein
VKIFFYRGRRGLREGNSSCEVLQNQKKALTTEITEEHGELQKQSFSLGAVVVSSASPASSAVNAFVFQARNA